MKWLVGIVVGVLFTSLYGLSLGGKGCVWFPEGGMPALEFSLWQEVGLPYGGFVELGGVYYRLFGIAFEDGDQIWGMFSGDMAGGMVSLGWRSQYRQWQVGFRVQGGYGWVWNMELRESVARAYIRFREGGDPLVVRMDTHPGAFVGWGGSGEVHYQWKRIGLGVLVGWMDFSSSGVAGLQWNEVAGGALVEKRLDRQGVWVIRGVKVGLDVRIVL